MPVGGGRWRDTLSNVPFRVCTGNSVVARPMQRDDDAAPPLIILRIEGSRGRHYRLAPTSTGEPCRSLDGRDTRPHELPLVVRRRSYAGPVLAEFALLGHGPRPWRFSLDGPPGRVRKGAASGSGGPGLQSRAGRPGSAFQTRPREPSRPNRHRCAPVGCRACPVPTDDRPSGQLTVNGPPVPSFLRMSGVVEATSCRSLTSTNRGLGRRASDPASLPTRRAAPAQPPGSRARSRSGSRGSW